MQVIEVAGQEILTKDKVPLRVNLNAGYRVTDVRVAFAKQAKPVDYLYKELQFGPRAADQYSITNVLLDLGQQNRKFCRE